MKQMTTGRAISMAFEEKAREQYLVIADKAYRFNGELIQAVKNANKKEIDFKDFLQDYCDLEAGNFADIILSGIQAISRKTAKLITKTMHTTDMDYVIFLLIVAFSLGVESTNIRNSAFFANYKINPSDGYVTTEIMKTRCENLVKNT